MEEPRYKPEGRGFDSRWFCEILLWLNTSGRTMDLRSTQPLTEMSTSDLASRVKAAGAYGWQPCHRHVPIIWKSWKPSKPIRTCTRIALPLLCSDIQAKCNRNSEDHNLNRDPYETLKLKRFIEECISFLPFYTIHEWLFSYLCLWLLIF
jgi:hypothetical protein